MNLRKIHLDNPELKRRKFAGILGLDHIHPMNGQYFIIYGDLLLILWIA